ncbi:hypothetical protein [Fournierella massiliensis]|uniref:hypothetical protein n=1 Tax=Allofournierella massiliensis TaxID=1650663 RepID=UPI00352293FE
MRALNPAYKLLTLIIASLMLSVTYNTRLDLVVAGCCFLVTLCTPRVDRKFLFISLTPFLIAAFGMFMTGLLFPSQAAAQGVETAVFGQRGHLRQFAEKRLSAGCPCAGFWRPGYAVRFHH